MKDGIILQYRCPCEPPIIGWFKGADSCNIWGIWENSGTEYSVPREKVFFPGSLNELADRIGPQRAMAYA